MSQLGPCDWLRMSQLNALFRKHFGIDVGRALLVPLILAVMGLAIGRVLPRFEATAFLQFPETRRNLDRPAEPRLPEQRAQDPKANVVELAVYKRVASSYDSVTHLRDYLDSAGLAGRQGAEQLLKQAAAPGFWASAVRPVLPFNRRDQKEFGDIKDASASILLGLELTTEAGSEPTASDMVDLLASYYVNAFLRDRLRAWILGGKVDAQSQEKGVRADILRAELDIELFGQRAEDMKAVLARYTDAARMDSRQVVSLNAVEGDERYLSPLAQLVGAESAISQRRELIRRWQRELKQKKLLIKFYALADPLLDAEVNTSRALTQLRSLATETFSHAEADQEWSQEAALRINGALDNFDVMYSQFGVRNGIRVGGVAGRAPLRLASIGLLAGLALLGVLVFVRATWRAASNEPERPSDVSSRI